MSNYNFSSNNYTLSTSDERIKQYTEEVTVRNSSIAVKGAFVVSVVVLAVLAYFQWNSLNTVISSFYVLFSAFAAFFAEKYFGERVKLVMENLCVFFLILTLIYQWFFAGGFYGIGCIWIIFTIIYSMYGTNGRVRNIALLLIGFEILVIIALNLLYPELVNNSMDEQEKILINIFSILAIGGYIIYVGSRQRINSDEVAIKVTMMQDDLTAQNQELIAVNEELIDLTEQLKAANDTQRHFTASMNHELRVPLNGIEGGLQILLANGNLDEADADTVKNALLSSRTMTQTVNDLLDFAKLEEGKFDIVKKPFDLRDLLDNIITMFTPQAKAKGLGLQIRIPQSTRVSIVADGIRIQQIMNNLISNAIKYTNQGNIVMSISTGSTSLDFKVSDTGQGMTKDQLKVLFDPFTRFNLKENGKIQGTGLGMNIVSNLVREMKGTIDVESRVKEGTAFTVSIPVMYKDCNITYLTPRIKDEAEELTDKLRGLKILNVDDMQINRTVIRGLLKKNEVELIDVESGRKAIDACLNNKYDVILMDHMMPEMDGVQALDVIRTQGMNKRTPVVMLTGNTGQEYIDLYNEHGANGHLMKPVLYDDLVAEICRVCGK